MGIVRNLLMSVRLERCWIHVGGTVFDAEGTCCNANVRKLPGLLVGLIHGAEDMQRYAIIVS